MQAPDEAVNAVGDGQFALFPINELAGTQNDDVGVQLPQAPPQEDTLQNVPLVLRVQLAFG